MKEKTKEKLNKITVQTFALFVFVSLILAIYLYTIGFHNLDIAHNEIDISEMVRTEYDKEFCLMEMRIDKKVSSLGQLYIDGLTQISYGYVFTLFSALMSGFIVAHLFHKAGWMDN